MGQNEIGPQSDGTCQDKMGQIGMAQILEVRTYAKRAKTDFAQIRLVRTLRRNKHH